MLSVMEMKRRGRYRNTKNNDVYLSFPIIKRPSDVNISTPIFPLEDSGYNIYIKQERETKLMRGQKENCYFIYQKEYKRN